LFPGGGEWDITLEIKTKKKAIPQGFFAEGFSRHGKQSRCHVVMNEYLLDVGHL